MGSAQEKRVTHSRAQPVELFLALTPPLGAGFPALAAIYLSVRKGRQLVRGLASDPFFLWWWAILLALGLASAAFASDKGTAVVGVVSAALCFWLYAVGRYLIEDPPAFLRWFMRAVGSLAALGVVEALTKVEVVLSLGKQSLVVMSPAHKGTLFGMGGNGLGPFFLYALVYGLGLLALPRGERASARIRRQVEGLLLFAVSAAAIGLLGIRNAIFGALVGTGVLVAGGFAPWVGALAAGGFGALMALYRPLGERIVAVFGAGAEAGRRMVAASALQMIKEHPFLGVGPHNFLVVYERYRNPQELENLGNPHNSFLRFGSEWGLPAAVLFFGWIYWRLWSAWRAAGRGLKVADSAAALKRVLVAVLVGFTGTFMFDDPLFTFFEVLPFWLLLGLLENPAW
ncbi:MAG: O-antigen ligase family protein [Bacillota bacterium]|nr:O-antigen ligase family protein [Bacillota bacterium]